MNILILLISISLLLVAGACLSFYLSVENGQFDDLDTPAVRILVDDDHE